MTSRLVTVTPSTPLKEASALFLKHGISGLPVVEGGRLVGVISESDIVAKETSGYSNGEVGAVEAAHLRRERAATVVAEAMTPDPVTIEPWASIWAAADVMVVRDVNRLPVVHEGALIGIVTRDDLVRAFARADTEIERDIRDHLLPSVGIAPEAVDVQVERGVVRIGGEIEPGVARECLQATVHLVPGVVRVEWEAEPAAAHV
jgi:CBS domain-containing protein